MKAQRDKVERMLKTARGQMDGILKMVEEDRYCMDISNQLLATQSILHKVNREIIQSHLQHCVKDALGGNGGAEKIDELMTLFDKLAK